MAGRVRVNLFDAAKPLTPHREPFRVRVLSHKWRAGAGCAAQACFIASPPMARRHVKEQGLRSAEGPRPIFSGQPLGAPLRRYVEPLPLAYRLFRGQRMSYRQRWTRAFQPGRGADEPLRWSVTPAAKRETTLSQMRPQARFAVLLGRRTLPHLAGRSRSRIPRGKEISASVSEVRSAGISGWMRGKSHSGNRSDEPDSPSSSR